MHRYYDPELGRYLTPDPIGLAGGINPFVYVLNDPVNYTDPLGLTRYFVSYDITSYSAVVAPVGISKISGTIISTTPNSDGTYTGIRFKGTFKGAAFGPLPWTKTVNNEEYFEDNCDNPDVARINGKASYFSGSMAAGRAGVSGGTYKFGDMIGTKTTPTKTQGFDLGIDIMDGRTWTTGTTMLFDGNVFPGNN